jgi:DNA (cytosine-5)-methyltransferase 1
MSPLKTIELFAGAGGMALGVERAGFEHEALLEIDPVACETLLVNRPAWPVVEADVLDVDFGRYGGVDLLTAGAPCQPFSMAGRRRLDQDERNLFPQVLRAVRQAQPRALLLENVKGMLINEARRYFDKVVDRLKALGYAVSWRLINCADYGVPQRRERVFIVGFRRDLGIEWTWPAVTHGLDALLHAQWTDGSYWTEHGLAMPEATLDQVELLEELWPARIAPHRRPWRTLRDTLRDPDGERAVLWDQPVRTITTQWNNTNRLFTIEELAGLQTFPDAWALAGQADDQLRQVGNAVPPMVAHLLAATIAPHLTATTSRGSRLALR